MSEHHTFRPTRRTALTGVATVGIGVPFLAACGGGSDSSAGSAGSAGAAPSAGTAVATTTDIEVGGGTIFADDSLVITQPTAGEFKGFSSICTHQGCPVTKVADGLIDCTCHGSKFSITDGAPTEGPATKPLASIALTVTGDQITVA